MFIGPIQQPSVAALVHLNVGRGFSTALLAHGVSLRLLEE
jgi:hypothetical protein